MGVPGLLSTAVDSKVLAQQWEGIFVRGRSQGPRIAVVSLLGYAYLAYDRSSRDQPWWPYLLAGALAIGIVPFTLGVMMPTNNALLGIARGTGQVASEMDVRALLLKWKNLNLVRSMLPLAGSIVGLWALLG